MNTLFPLPPRSKTKLELAKEKHSVETFHSDLPIEDHPWIACHMPTARRIAQQYEGVSVAAWSLPELFAGYCRLIEESGAEATGETEVDAVLALCFKMHLPCIL